MDDGPLSATDAAGALLALHDSPGNPTPGPLGDGDSLLDALTLPPDVGGKRNRLTLRGQYLETRRRARAEQASQLGVLLDLPAVVTTLPFRPRGSGIGQWIAADWHDDVRTGEGWASYPYPVGHPIDTGPRYRDNQRARRVVLAGPTGHPEAPPTPAGSWALTVSVLTARAVAADLDTWATSLKKTRDVVRVRAEADVYRTYADDAEALLPAAFGWLDQLPEPERSPAFPTVPATAAGFARLGIETER